MDHAIQQQVLMEHQTLSHVTSALRATVGWKYEAADLTRKLASLRFVGQSFQRHLKHLLALEEESGYLAVVIETRPEMGDQVEALRTEHDSFRKGVNRILTRLRRIEPTDKEALAKTSDELLTLLDRLDEHSKKETDLVQHALFDDEGGEG